MLLTQASMSTPNSSPYLDRLNGRADCQQNAKWLPTCSDEILPMCQNSLCVACAEINTAIEGPSNVHRPRARPKPVLDTRLLSPSVSLSRPRFVGVGWLQSTQIETQDLRLHILVLRMSGDRSLGFLNALLTLTVWSKGGQ